MSLLPPNATALERAFVAAIDRPLPNPIRQVWDPDTCPADLLPWLAWALSVDVWNPDWTVDQKRGAIRNSIFIHQRKGTIGAIRGALNALGFDLQVMEWFQKEPAADPYTFGVDVIVEQIGIPTQQDFDNIEHVALSAKNLRSHLTSINVRAISRGAVTLGACLLAGETVTISAEP